MRLAAKLSAALLALSLVAGACTNPAGRRAGATTGGTASLAAAGSLEGVIQSRLQPAFARSSGDHLVAKFAGSTALAQMIKDGELAPGDFLSIGEGAIRALWPGRARYSLTIATDPLVLAYSPKSRYASQLDQIRLHRRPLADLFKVLESPGFRLGRTDPNLDPQGGYFILMFELATRLYHLPADTVARILGVTKATPTGSSGQIVDEDALATDIASGTFDAGSEFLTEARQYHLEYIKLPAALDFADPSQLALYRSISLPLARGLFRGGLITLDVTSVLAPPGRPEAPADRSAAGAFLAFLLSREGERLLSAAGYQLHRPSLSYAPGWSKPAQVLPRPVLRQYRRLGG